MKSTNSNLIAKILFKAKQNASAVSWGDIQDKPSIPDDVSDLTDLQGLLGGVSTSSTVVDGGSANSTYGGSRNINGGDVNG